jgi:putative SOS response-associated peptidase YedK
VNDPSELKSDHINARADRLTKSPMFRPALYRRRCLVPATGFFEWQAQGQKQPKQPYLLRQQDAGIFAFAGLWERWTDADGNDIDSFTILTTDPNELVKPMHNRMPVVLPRDAWDTWLDPEVRAKDQLMNLLGPPEAKGWEAVPVSRRINNPANDDAEAVDQIGASTTV